MDDEASHNTIIVAQNKFYDDLLKQSGMVPLGRDVYRRAVRQIQPDTVKDALRVFLGDHPSKTICPPNGHAPSAPAIRS